jgi:uncharacterized membrane protein YeaQ/YmgE (transglycosylase-associated protein family)
MDLTSLLIFLAIGAVAGWLAGLILKGRGFGLLGDIGIGCLGALIGGWLFRSLDIHAGGLIGDVITATVGAVVFIVVIRLLRKLAAEPHRTRAPTSSAHPARSALRTIRVRWQAWRTRLPAGPNAGKLLRLPARPQS